MIDNQNIFGDNSNSQNFPGPQNIFKDFFGDTNHPINEIFREMERSFGLFNPQSRSNEDFNGFRPGSAFNQGFNANSGYMNNPNQNTNPQQHGNDDFPRSSQYNYNFKKPQNSNKDIADV